MSQIQDAPQDENGNTLNLLPFLALGLRLAYREFRNGFHGFRIFLGCLVIGVGAIAAVGSVSESLVAGLNAKGRLILGGDISLHVHNRELTPTQRDWLAQRFTLSHYVSLRGMAQTLAADGAGDIQSVLAEVKAVDNAYPLVGRVTLKDPQNDFQTALQNGVVVEQALLDRLQLKRGEAFQLGTSQLVIAGVLDNEPDRLAGGFALGPRILLTQSLLAQTGLATPGSLTEHHYLLTQPAASSQLDLANAVAQIKAQFPNAEGHLRDRRDASPSLRRSIERIAIFLTLVGLTALVVGGVGVGNAVSAYLARRRQSIGILKSLGASARLIYLIYLCQIGLMTLIGIVVGLVIGAVFPYMAHFFVADLLPFEMNLRPHANALLPAAAFGVLTAFIFAMRPLQNACAVPATNLFQPRDLMASTRRQMTGFSFVPFAFIATALGLVLVALYVVQRIDVTLYFILGLLASYLLLRLAAYLLMRLARAIGRPRNPILRLALANLYRPGAPTKTAMLTIGLSVTLLSIITLVDGNLNQQFSKSLPADTPSYFLLDVQTQQLADVKTQAEAVSGFGGLNAVPMLRGRVTHMAGVPAAQLRPPEDVDWVLRGDRGITYSDTLPQGSELVAGQWWPQDYQGPALVSIEDRVAYGFGLSIGDDIGFNILGRDMTARIASLRKVDYQNMGLNFVFVFSPNMLTAAPHTHAMTVTLNEEDPQAVLAFRQNLLRQFPNISIIRVKESVEQIFNLLADLNLGVRVMSVITILAGVLVLAGALASGHHMRLFDTVMLKVLGASRRQILAVYLFEYLMLGLGAALIAASVGGFAAYLIIVKLMQIEFVLLSSALLVTILGATSLTICLGLIGTWQILGAKSVPVLRAG